MRKISVQMNLLMGLTMSFGLSIIGFLTGADLSKIPPIGIIMGILIGFVISLIISVVIGFLVPMKKVGDGVCQLFKVSSNAVGGKVLSALASDLIYTPIITFAMTFMNYQKNVAQGIPMPPYGLMFVKSLIICFICGFILIFIFQPLYLKLVLKKNGVEM